MSKQVVTYGHGVPWEAEFGVTQGYGVDGRIHIAGQFAHDMKGNMVGEGDFVAQVRQTFENLDRVLAAFDVERSNIAEIVIYMTNPKEHLEPFVAPYRAFMGEHRTAATLIGVTALAFPHQLIEIRAVAYAGG